MPEQPPEPALSLPLCEWVTCEDTYAEPGSIYCKPHGRQARAEGAPWRWPGTEAVLLPDQLRAGERPPADTVPPPVAPALQPEQPTCRIDGCTDPPLAKTITSRSNRWRNLCEQHYAEARLGALGAPRRAQLETAAAALRNENGNNPTPEIRPATTHRAGCDLPDRHLGPCLGPAGKPLDVVLPLEPPPGTTALLIEQRSYSDRAAELVELAAELDDAREALEVALTRWRLAVAELAA